MTRNKAGTFVVVIQMYQYEMKNLPHIPKGLFAVLLGPKMEIKMSQGMALCSAVGTFVFWGKCTQSKLETATQLTHPRNVFLKFLNPCQHGNCFVMPT
jgi:hypothetical protein